MLTNGQGKARAKRDGTGRKPQEWRVLFLSTGEVTLADKVREDGKRRAMAGQAVRVVDIPADAGAGLGIFEDLQGFENAGALARHLGEASGRFYGAPLRAFLEYLTTDRVGIAELSRSLAKSFSERFCPAGADGQVRRVAARFGLVAAAGEIGASCGVLPWPEGEAMGAAGRCFQDFIAARGGTGAAEVSAGLAQVRQFFQAHGSSRFETWGETAGESKVINRAGFRRKDEQTGEWSYYVFQEVFKGEVCQGFNLKMILGELKALRLLLVQDAEHLTVKPRIPGLGSGTRFYHVAPAVTGNGKTLVYEKTTGTNGDTGDTLARLASHVPGPKNDTGDTGDKTRSRLESVPGCPRSPGDYRGRPEASDSNVSPVVPGVPGQNNQVEDLNGEDEVTL